MKIAVLKETLENENRVALIPDTVKRLVKNGYEVSVEKDAGKGANYLDADYEKAGAKIEGKDAVLSSDIVVKIQPPSDEEIKGLKEASVFISLFYPLSDKDTVNKLKDKKVTSFSLDMIPRTTLAQSMDVLSSMSTAAGYKAALIAANKIQKFFPMFMTAAGTVAPAKVLVIGAGVAGLQAIATCKRLGAVVEAFDQRVITKDQVQSLGGKFIEVPTEETGETEGGYAKEMSDDYKQKQAELIAKHIKKSDIVITTALIPGRPAPKIITGEMVKSMKEGSVIVDLAADFGGNTEGAKAGTDVVVDGVTIVGPVNLPSSLSFHTSQMFAKNIEKYLEHLVDQKEQKFNFNMEDEITKGSLITKDGEIVNEAVKNA